MRRRMMLAALAISALLGASGCEAIPQAGPVQKGLPDLHQAEHYVQFNPLGPVSGSSQEDIVRGFLLAASSSSDDYAVAREFLAPGYAGQWDPNLGVLVDDGGRPYERQNDTAGALQLTAIANVDAEGRMLPAAAETTRELRFEFERVGDEWRISSAPAGIVLDRATFTAVWSPHQLYFLGPNETLVPDTRWFVSSAALPTEIVHGLLEGPGGGLAESVRSAFPPDTELVTGAVAVVDGRARVDLSAQVAGADERSLAEMQRQLRESLRTVTGVSGIDLYSDGASVRLPEVDGERQSTHAETSNPAVLIDDAFGTLAAGEFQEVAGLSEAIVGLDPDAIALSSDGSAAAVRNADGVTLLSEGERRLVDAGEGLLEPSVDPFGFVWTYRSGEAELNAFGAGDARVRLRAPWLDEQQPVAVSLSPDGMRVAALVPSAGGSAVLVATVTRDEEGLPLLVAETADTQMIVRGSPVDLDWVDPVRFVVLTRSGTAGKVSIGGPGLLSNEQGSVPEGMKIASGGSRSQLRVLAGDRALYTSQGSGWQRAIGDVRVLAKRG